MQYSGADRPGGLMRHRAARSAAVAAAIAALTVGLAVPGADAQDRLTFSVGTTQDIDTLNVTAGFLVIDYEIWNLTLPTLTDKAAADFAVQPGLAESWTSSEDGLTWTYTLRDGMTWSDGEPLTAEDVAYTINRSVEEDWQNHVSATGNLTARGHRRHDARDHLGGPRPEAAGARRVHRPAARVRGHLGRRPAQLPRRRQRRRGAVPHRRARGRRIRSPRTQPELVRHGARDGRGDLPDLRQRRGPVQRPARR